MDGEKKKVLFVCLGNICRSPMAHAIFEHLLKEKNQHNMWEVDSAAIGDWHIGKQPDERALKVLKENAINFRHTVRQITKSDFKTYDYIFGMDEQNMQDLSMVCGSNKQKAKVELLGKWDPQKVVIIPDPYFDTQAEFYPVYDQCYRCCKAFLESFN
ncbi:low molecular weight phosphotyrosine protein phosphatase isoform X2 [Octopus vulgaris]|uniref:Low molecular weight phosphotyrosine protein phosphatase isoform X2 n=2 Tax=Octopus TaxID=6643 RepID=A0AA36B1A9_OCTVU|nr:low molecular weight phosphotyrosine protein phosphatase [Octopus sinensis]CAI9726115.1 low molecular weight phosphotyrosine protein phosphatase isoform X2 [Octopus vulgaris]